MNEEWFGNCCCRKHCVWRWGEKAAGNEDMRNGVPQLGVFGGCPSVSTGCVDLCGEEIGSVDGEIRIRLVYSP